MIRYTGCPEMIEPILIVNQSIYVWGDSDRTSFLSSANPCWMNKLSQAINYLDRHAIPP